ncbi:MAG TPA: hypothetical protein VFI24_02005 [Pyrinomonadaceae bacterium]|nr:hypothetical protein [Pyrinomonadaceae bacterium]
METQYPNDSQEDINKGQRRINYELVRVDDKLIDVVRMLVELLKQTKALHPPTAGARILTVETIENALKEAYEISAKVADIKPPGCEAPYPN